MVDEQAADGAGAVDGAREQTKNSSTKFVCSAL